MKKTLKKSEVLKEGYIKGLKKAQSIIESAIAGESEHKEHVLWSNDWEQVESIMEDIRNSAMEEPEIYEWAFDKNGEIDEDALREAAWEDCNMYFDDEIGNLETIYGDEVYVTGSLGLWNGSREVGRGFGGIKEAIEACMEETNKIYVYGDNLYVDASHHDGTNSFTIYGVDQDALYALDKKVEERYDPDSEDSDYLEIYDVDTLEKAYDYDIITEEEYNACFVSLGQKISKHYGW